MSAPGRKRKAFTLLELIVVIVVLGILSLVAIPTFSGVEKKTTDQVELTSMVAVSHEAIALARLNQDPTITEADFATALADCAACKVTGASGPATVAAAPTPWTLACWDDVDTTVTVPNGCLPMSSAYGQMVVYLSGGSLGESMASSVGDGLLVQMASSGAVTTGSSAATGARSAYVCTNLVPTPASAAANTGTYQSCNPVGGGSSSSGGPSVPSFPSPTGQVATLSYSPPNLLPWVPAAQVPVADGSRWVLSSDGQIYKQTGTTMTFVAGQPNPTVSATGSGSAASFYRPSLAGADSAGNLYVNVWPNQTTPSTSASAGTPLANVYKVTPAGVVSNWLTFNGAESYWDGYLTPDGTLYECGAFGVSVYKNGVYYGNDGQSPSQPSLYGNLPGQSSGAVFSIGGGGGCVADQNTGDVFQLMNYTTNGSPSGKNAVVRLTPNNTPYTVLAGQKDVFASTDGSTGATSAFAEVQSWDVAAGTLYVLDGGLLRSVDVSTGAVATVSGLGAKTFAASGGDWDGPASSAVISNDSGTPNIQYDPQPGTLLTIYSDTATGGSQIPNRAIERVVNSDLSVQTVAVYLATDQPDVAGAAGVGELGQVFQAVAAPDGSVYAVTDNTSGYHFDVIRVATDGTVSILDRVPYYDVSFTVDSSGSVLFYGEGGGNSGLYKATATGATLIGTLPSTVYSYGGLVPDNSGGAYLNGFDGGPDGYVYHIAADGTTTEMGSVSGQYFLGLAQSGSSLYMQTLSGSVYSMPLAGGTPTQIVSGGISSAGWATLSAADGHLYIVSAQTIWQAPASGGTWTPLTTNATAGYVDGSWAAGEFGSGGPASLSVLDIGGSPWLLVADTANLALRVIATS